MQDPGAPHLDRGVVGLYEAGARAGAPLVLCGFAQDLTVSPPGSGRVNHGDEVLPRNVAVNVR